MDGNEELTHSRPGRRLLLIGLAAVAVIAAALACMRWLLPGLPQISEADLAVAEKRWEAAELKNYDIAIRLNGRQTGELRCSVRDGAAIGLKRNGVAMKDERTWRYWSVPGMFETLRTDFENAAHAADKFGSAEVKVVLRAEFDPTYGFPRRYLQQVFGQQNDLTWEVFEFTPQ